MKKINQENNEHIFTFSQELRDRLKKMIKDRAGKEVSDGEADIGLDKFARLMKVTIKIMDQMEKGVKEKIKNRKRQNIAVMVQKIIEPKETKGLVFVMHGLGGFKEQPHIETFANTFYKEGYTVVRFDTTNTIGESDGDMADATLTNYYEDLEDVIAWAQGKDWFQEPFILAGHSLGGICSALFAEKYPNRVKAILPASTVVSGLYTEESLDFKAIATEWQNKGIREWESSSQPGILKRLKWSHVEDRRKYDLIPEVGKLTMPVLLIVGGKDDVTPLEHQQILFDKLPGKKELHVIKDSYHTFTETEHLNEISEIIRKWVNSLDQ